MERNEAAGNLIARRARLAFGQIEISVWDGSLWLRPILHASAGMRHERRRVSLDELTADPEVQAAALVLAKHWNVKRGYILLKIKDGRCVHQEAGDAISENLLEWLKSRHPELNQY